MRTKATILSGLAALNLLLFGSTAAAGDTPLTTERVVTGLSATVFVTSPPRDYDRLFVIERLGRIRIVNLHTRVLNEADFLDVDPLTTGGGERGLLGLAFHPNYWQNGYFYINYTALDGATVVARYQVSADRDVADAGSAQTVITFSQPFNNHNGGWIGFGPDGYLYVATGDGGSANDPGNRAQAITDQKLGKMLRLDVDGDDFPGSPTQNYAIPPDNPYVGVTGDDELWHIGLRNPWRCCFDRVTGELYIADVGQDLREEVDIQPAGVGGLNFGWRCMEGFRCTGLSGCTCNSIPLTLPVHEYTHAGGNCSITGGCVYRGPSIPDLQGTYFFADYCTANIWSFEWDGASIGPVTDRTTELDPAVGNITTVTSFGEDGLGEIYIVEGGGEVWKIVPNTPPISVGSCFGTGCPCGNDDPAAGCANSTGQGGRLLATGTASVSADDLTLVGTQLSLDDSGLFYMGDALASNPFFDGMQCAIGNQFRFLTSIQDTGPTGAMTFTGVVGAAGGLISAGTSWSFQGWHRDIPASPCGTGANLTHVLTISFTP